MKNRVLAPLRVAVAVVVMLFATNLAPLASVYANQTEAEQNQTTYWQNQGYGTCTKANNLSDLSYAVPAAPADSEHTLAVVKAGSDVSTEEANEIHETLAAGDVLTHTSGKELSHVILCYKSTIPTTTPVTAAEVTKVDTCGTDNDSYTVPTTENVTYSQPAGTYNNATGTVTITATADEDYVLTAPYTFTHTFNSDACPTVAECTTFNKATKVAPSNLNGFDFSQTRSTGHYEFTEDGLRIWTEGATSTDKVAGYKQVDVALANVGDPMLDYDNTAGGLPGYQLYLDNGHGTAGFIVGEPSVYGDNWWSNQDFGVGSGMGYASYGTLDEYLQANPDARVKAFGFSLGSGVKGDGVLQNITFGCDKYVFKADKVANKVTLCHATGSLTNPYRMITVSAAGAYNGHLGNDHQNGRDIIPPFTFKGETYSQNWDAPHKVIYNNDCKVVGHQPPKDDKVTLCHATGSLTNPYRMITVSAAGAYNGHYTQHDDDIIPEFTYKGTTYDAKNWTVAGQAIYNNKCKTVVTPPVDVCPNLSGTQTSVPKGYVKDDVGDCVQPGGRGGEDTTEKTVVTVLGIDDTSGGRGADVQTEVNELAETGANSLAIMLLGLTIISMALGSAFAVRKSYN